MNVLDQTTLDHDKVVFAAKNQWFGCNDIDVIGGSTLPDGREVVFIHNLTSDSVYRFFVKRSETGSLMLEEYPWANDKD